MKKLNSVVAASFMVMAAACSSDVNAPEIRKQAVVIDCDETRVCDFGFSLSARTPSDTIPAQKIKNQIVLGEDGVMALIFDAAVLGQLKPGTRFEIAGLSGPTPSDTIPGPAPVGVVRAAYNRLGGSAFAAVLGIGAPAPSDTIPGPSPIGHVSIGNYDADAAQEALVWTSLKYLSDSKIISSSTTHLLLSVKNGKNTLTSTALPVSIIAPEKIWTH